MQYSSIREEFASKVLEFLIKLRTDIIKISL